MFNLKKKSLINFIAFTLLLLFICSLIPSVRHPVLGILRNPLSLLTLISREIRGVVFYHRNFVENERLVKQADLLKQKLNTLQEISLENERLKDLLHFKQGSSFKVIPAQVIGRSADNWSSVIITNKGSFSGIKPGMAVMTYLGLAGRVIETQASTSKVMLVNDPDFGVSALVQRSRHEGLVSGTLGNFLIMRYLTKDSDIKAADTIVTSGLSPKFPKGLNIGTVVDVGDEFSGLGRYCLIKPSVNLSGIEEVLIIIQ